MFWNPDEYAVINTDDYGSPAMSSNHDKTNKNSIDREWSSPSSSFLSSLLHQSSEDGSTGHAVVGFRRQDMHPSS